MHFDWAILKPSCNLNLNRMFKDVVLLEDNKKMLTPPCNTAGMVYSVGCVILGLCDILHFIGLYSPKHLDHVSLTSLLDSFPKEKSSSELGLSRRHVRPLEWILFCIVAFHS